MTRIMMDDHAGLLIAVSHVSQKILPNRKKDFPQAKSENCSKSVPDFFVPDRVFGLEQFSQAPSRYTTMHRIGHLLSFLDWVMDNWIEMYLHQYTIESSRESQKLPEQLRRRTNFLIHWWSIQISSLK
jgi:hypothetical protein